MIQMPCVEAAARPLLYPRSAFGDSDIRERLLELGHLLPAQLPAMRLSFLRKALSRCRAYAKDYLLQILIYDVAKARQLTAITNVKD